MIILIIEHQSSIRLALILRAIHLSPPLGESKSILLGSAANKQTLPRDVSTALRLLNMTENIWFVQ